MTMNNRALIAMSGGVDSSAAALLLRQEGYECVGVNMKLWCGEAGVCGSPEDSRDAQTVCEKLGMEFHMLDFTREFSREVIDRFVAEYESGGTPNPCIECNRHMKFGKLLEEAKRLGCDTLVTGHYAQVEYCEETGRWLLKKAANEAKDQSYVLYFLTQEQLAHIRLPLGEYASKEDIRALAQSRDLINARKKDSQDICFVPNGDYAGFITRRTGKDYPEGDFVDNQGKPVGRHKGLIRYTIGQRRGLGVALCKPMYVKYKDVEKNQVVLSTNEELFSSRLVAENFNWISIPAPDVPIRAMAKTRYQAKEAPVTATVLSGGQVEVVFDTPQRALTMGQSVVLYHGDTVVGGGVIRKV